MIAVTPDSYTPVGDAVIALEGMKPSYGDETMRINYRLAMRKMLQPLSSEERQLVVDKLNSSAYQPVQIWRYGRILHLMTLRLCEKRHGWTECLKKNAWHGRLTAA